MLSTIVNVCSSNDLSAWSCLYSFTTSVLTIPNQKIPGRTLSSLLRENLNRFHRERVLLSHPDARRRTRGQSSEPEDASIARVVQLKLAQGDVSAAARRLLSTDVLAPADEETRRILQLKHPDLPPSVDFPPTPSPVAPNDETPSTSLTSERPSEVFRIALLEGLMACVLGT